MKPTLPLLLVSLALSACAAGAQQAPVAGATGTPAVAQAPVAAPAPAPAPAPVPAPVPAAAPAADLAAGRQAFEQGCFACHDQATIVSTGGRSRAEWQEVVAMMQDRGFSGTPNEIQLIVDYLTATYPPTPKP